MDLKKLISSKKFLLSSIFIVTFLITIGFIWLVYSKDEPKVIPPETRGKIREGVKEEVVRPVESVFPTVGRAMRDAAYGGSPETTVATTTTNPSNSTANWKTYRNEEQGFEFKYPGNWDVIVEGNTLSINPYNNKDTGLWIYSRETDMDAASWWGNESKKYDAKFTVTQWVTDYVTGIKAHSNEGLIETHYIATNRGRSLDLLIVGTNSTAESVAGTLNLF